MTLAGYGVDRLSVSFPLRCAPDRDAFTVDTTQRSSREDAGRPVLSTTVPVHQVTDVRGRQVVQAGVFVGATQLAGAWWAKVECNPARLIDPAGCSLLPVDELDDVAAAAFAAARDLVHPEVDDVQAANVKRLDIARDFAGVDQPGPLLWGLLPQRRRHARFQAVWSDPKHKGAQTLWVGSGAGSVRLYDQHEAYADKGAEEGRLRWELEARAWLCQDTKQVTLGQLLAAESRIHEMCEQRWEWSRMGVDVVPRSDLVARVSAMAAAGGFVDEDGEWRRLSRARAQRVLGQLLASAAGDGFLGHTSAKATSADYERIKRALGAVPESLLALDQVDAEPIGRLDWQSGTLVAA
jgi:hypothetical protein